MCVYLGLKIHHQILDSLERANTLLVAGAPDSEVDKALHWVIIGGEAAVITS